MKYLKIKNYYIQILFIFFLGVFLDKYFFININTPPAWDQGYHLSNLYKTYNLLKENNIFETFDDLLDITDNYRGPLTYLISSFLLKIFGNSYSNAYLSNNLFNLISIISIYEFGKIIKDKETGLLAAVLFTFSPFIIIQRTDYLIDISLTSFVILTFLLLSKWFLDKNEHVSRYSVLCGIGLALIFLVKPTGIILFFIPLIFNLINKVKYKKNKIYIIYEYLLFISIFLVIIFPWFSRHWLTIISSTINAFSWGINYQKGLDGNTLEGWVYYLKEIPFIMGYFNFGVIISLIIIERLKIRKHHFLESLNKKNLNYLCLIFFISYYIISSLMSTKDTRFIMPLYPLICIYFAIFIDLSRKNFLKKNLIIFALSLSIVNSYFSNNYYFLSKKYFYDEWYHKDIINSVSIKNPELISTLAVLPDTKEINTFNLEAEAQRQGGNIAVRQIISNQKTYKDDLGYFDWFLLKDGYQGVMSNKAKDLLNTYLLKNNSFVVEKKWTIPDGSKLILLRRKNLNSNIKTIKCDFKNPTIYINKINNGINFSIKGRGKYLRDSNLIVDLFKNKKIQQENFIIANGLYSKEFNENYCYEITQESTLNFDLFKNENDIFYKTKLINLDNKEIYLNQQNKSIILKSDIEESKENSIMRNKINSINQLGNYLREGNFKNLFDSVGILNQSDPQQKYLIHAEKLFKYRYKNDNNINNLYNILISQILQKKVKEANHTIDKILVIEKNNGNANLTRAIINLYDLNIKKFKKGILEAKNNNTSQESKDILKTLEIVSKILDFKFMEAYQLL